MADPSPATPSPPTERPTDLHIVLFGMPAAGKSSLLGALAQAAEAQEHLLNGHLVDTSHGLAELRQRLYDEAPRRTAEEVVPYPVDFEPFSPDRTGVVKNAREHLGAVLIDCDGRVANDLLVRRGSLDEDSPEGTLAHEVLDADTLVLVIDASAPPAQVDADFAEFDRFLRQMERGRSRRTEVGGLPVFLVLTKCDLLAQPGDSAADWMERIEQRKRDVDARFRDFLARRQEEAGPLPFGRLDLHVWATAVKRPALGPAPPKPREPYGVAELFRQCLEQAAAFRDRRLRSGRRLVWIAGGAAALVTLLAALTVGLLFRYNTRPTELQVKVEFIRGDDRPTAAERLDRPPGALRERLSRLREVRNDPHFDSLPADQQQLVRDRLRELQTYLAYLDKLRGLPRTADIESEQELQDLRDRLEELALPQAEWEQTEAGRLRAEKLDEVGKLERAVGRVRDWYLDGTRKAEELRTFADYRSAAGINWRDWSAEAERLLDPARKPPSADAQVRDFDSVARARSDWEKTRPRLEGVLNVAAALGLAGPVKDRPPVLVIPRNVSLEQAGVRLRRLRDSYPDYEKQFTLEGLPDAIVPAVQQAAHTSYEYLLEPGRAAVLDHLRQAGTGREETRARWDAVREWLKSPDELASWRQLATVLARLQERDAEDPVTALATFLARKEFTINLARVTLEVPDAVNTRPAPGARFQVFHVTDTSPALEFEQSGEPERDARRRLWVYHYRRLEGRSIRCKPGEDFWARIEMRNDRRLTWAISRSAVYQFECLRRPPRLHRKGESNTTGTREDGVRLLLSPPEGVPPVPDLMPVVVGLGGR